MLNKIIENKLKIHTRDIRLATYSHTNNRIIVHGTLKDHRHIKIFDITGSVAEPGIIHHMDVKLLIKTDPLTIQEAQAQMIHSPLPECAQTLDTIHTLRGLEIKSGFSKQVRNHMGGKKGCTHLCQLVVAMGQEIVHGWLTLKRKNKPDVPKDLDSFSDKNYLLDSCRMWTGTGPKLARLEQAVKSAKNA